MHILSTIAMILSALEALSRDLLSRQCSPSPSHSEGISITLGPQEREELKVGKSRNKEEIDQPPDHRRWGDRQAEGREFLWPLLLCLLMFLSSIGLFYGNSR